MRSYSGQIVFETIFDSVPTNNVSINSLVEEVFYPKIPPVSDDCKTTLGTLIDVNYEIVGRTELATKTRITRARVNSLLAAGNYKVAVYDLSSCIAKGGYCRSCYGSDRQGSTNPLVGTPPNRISPYFEKSKEGFTLNPKQAEITLGFTPDLYDILKVYDENGALISPASYTVVGNKLTFNSTSTAVTYRVAKYTVLSKTPFLYWLGKTYAGSLLGIKPIAGPALPIRKSLLTSQISQSVLDLAIQETVKLPDIPQEMLDYLNQIGDKLEKSLFTIALYSIYSNITS